MFISKTEPINKPLKFILYKFKNALYDSDITPLPDEKEFRDVLKRYLKEKEELDKKKMEGSKESKDDGCVTPVNRGDGDQKQIITSNELYSIISNNDYVKGCKTNQKKDPSSLSYLIDRPLSQSDCIKLGTAIEKVVSDIITKYTNYQNIKQKNAKGKKEKDHLFKDDKNKIIYYAELKGNLNLDTEKSTSTYNKCLKIVEDLKEKFPEYNIKWCLLGLRYLDYNNIPNNIKKKYEIIKDNLFGINQYLDYLNINYEFTQDIYKQFLNDIANIMVD
tara:strand:+ start:675 stop:1502 length:828 start_codon:yes stop_codon:yes gene_type:complete